MFYNLPNGKTISISLELYIALSDEELSLLIAENIGEDINDPFSMSSLEEEYLDDEIEINFSEKEIYEIPQEEKINDLDVETEE